jgi:hypothetical protein
MRYEVEARPQEDENGWPSEAHWGVLDTETGAFADFGTGTFTTVTEWAEGLNNEDYDPDDLSWTTQQKNTLPNPSPEIVETVDPPASFVETSAKYRLVSDSTSLSARWGVKHMPSGKTAWFGPHKGSAEFAISELVRMNYEPGDIYVWS